ncbi:hypothetical protein [Cellulomonas aerilata]|uniref:Uncharacterized protein n=1 Tax=Cellulomonas aerilata TaxID=515326 RepID=A0A512D9Q4_9CELL|nr:hypothetical protein [Cellulomonas aerilata]GEO33181.1 hypothetical protein CAE01nite_09060 [Cellulomonas aerilata]
MPLTTPYTLVPTPPRRRALDALATRLPRVGLDGVLADLDRAAEPCDVPGRAAGRGFTWAPEDRDDTSWTPQGLACLRSGDVVLVAWYARRRLGVATRGSRLTVVDRRDPEQPRYGHVLLTTPRRLPGAPTLGRVGVHAGGIAVVGDLLYVADTLGGVRVFRLADVVAVPRRRLDAALPWRGAGTRTLGRRLTGGYTALGHDHVLPELMRLRAGVRAGLRRLRWSFLSVGELDGRPCLVAGEYGRKGSTPRLAVYALDPRTGLPAVDPDGRCRPVEVHEDQPPRMQGAAVAGSTWYLTASTGEGNPGDLHVGTPGHLRRHRGVLPTGPEDVDWARPGEELWCQTEWPGRRWVFPIDVRRWPGPPGADEADGGADAAGAGHAHPAGSAGGG